VPTSRPLAALVLLLLAATACSAEIDVAELHDNGASHGPVDGLPFRTYERYEVAVWRRKPEGGFEKVHSERRVLPDQDRLYLLRYTGLPLASATSKVKLRADGTLASVDLTDVNSSADESLQALGAQLQAVGQARKAEEQAQATARAAGDTAELDYYKAVKEALDKADQLAALPSGDPGRGALDRELRLLQITANLRARAAGKDPPFPGADL
jgi:hypothetical protein